MTELNTPKSELDAFFEQINFQLREGMESIIEIQTLSFIDGNGKKYLNVFLTGDGFFCQVPDFELFKSLSVSMFGGLIATLDYYSGSGIEIMNIGRTVENRDFRKHSLIDNLRWALEHSEKTRKEMYIECYRGSGIFFFLHDSDVINILYRNDPERVISKNV